MTKQAKTLDLVARLIRFYAWPGARVLDPFAGAGTVGIAARDLGCRADLVEIDAAVLRSDRVQA